MPSLGDQQSTTPGLGDPVAPINIEEIKAQQTLVRRKITRTCNAVDRVILEGGSRGGGKALLQSAVELHTAAEKLNDLLIDEADYDRHHNDHLRYTELIGHVTERFEQYLQDRAGDADSVAPPNDIDAQRERARQQALADAKRRAAAALAEAEVAAEAVRRLQLDGEEPTHDPTKSCHSRRASSVSTGSDSLDDTAPDAWIDLYRDGQLPPVRRAGSRSSVKADLEPFFGKALDWFGWIDLFRALVHDTEKDSGEKLAILKRSLRGDCRDVVYGLGGGEAAYIEALVRLKQAYGRRDVIRAAHTQALEKLELKSDPTTFKRYAEKVRTHLFDLSRIGETATADIIERICLRLNLADRVAWTSGRGDGLESRSLNEFGSWLCQRAAAYQNAHSIAAEQMAVPGQNQRGERHQARTNKAEGKTRPQGKGKPSNRPFCFRCEGEHRLEDCQQFKTSSVGDRVGFCIRHRLCFCCFGPRHSSRDCQYKKPCQHAGCQMQHHPLLHDTDAAGPERARAHHAMVKRRTVALGVIQLEAVSADGSITPTNIMLDEGSDTTLIREGLARRLKLSGRDHTLDVEGVGGARSRFNSRRVQLQLRASDGSIVNLEGSTMPVVTRPVPVVDWERLKQRWRHLSDLPLRSSGGQVDVLIGLDQAHLMAVVEARVGGRDEPIASKTALGWIVRGVVNTERRPLRARIHTAFVSMEGEKLESAVKQFCDTENFGTEHQVPAISVDERQAVDILDQGTKQLAVGYEVPITWKPGEPILTSNRQQAEKRLISLQRKFAQEPDFALDYDAAMEKYFEKGYAVAVQGDALGDPEYYLPHHGVQQGSKVRVVFDAAARYRGKCLNDAIFSGPALQTPLPSVLIGFREGEIAWASDVEAMFSRFRLRPEEARFFRFLWQRKGEEKVTTYEMRRLPFGATCSPFIAIHTTRRIPVDFQAPADVVNAISKKMYVDDYLSSAKSVQIGLKEAVGVKETLAKGDLHLQGWISNSPEFLHAISTNQAETTEDGLALAGDDAEKVLGVVWRPQSDTIGFRVEEPAVTYTRVGLLSQVASIFDPLGLAAPLTVKAKIRLRLLGTKGLEWSDAVTNDDKRWWEEWFATLPQLNHIRMKRCLFPDEDNIIRSELHTFGDASEEAYAAVVYLRNVYSDGRVGIHQLKAATKLAPKQTLSVPRLELNASLLAARLARFVTGSLSRKIHKRYFWTDSSTVRNWIRATASFYVIFVSNRIGEIQTLTEALEWRFIPGKLNPADAATRSTMGDEAIPSLWLDGPPFLLGNEDDWPRDLPWMAVTEELRPVRSHHTFTSTSTFDWGHVNIRKLDIPALARLASPFFDFVKRCQAESYQDELGRLKKGKELRSTSSLLSLSPLMGEDGLLRLGHRAKRVQLPYDRVHPPLLPGRHPLAKKIILAFHEELNHVGTDFLLSYIQQYFWITSGREAIKKVRRDCPVCRRNRAKPGCQLMGELPDSRLEFGTSPFRNTACDLFGPMETGLARNRTAKRWGVLFTCLVTRAVYLDLVPSLSSDDFLLSLRRFIGLYGKPKKIHSDNGTNFVGAERELREAALALYESNGLANFFKDREIEWTFQPPRTPHFGGAHESLVRSTKKALYRALEMEAEKLRYPTEDTLRTVLFEVAGLLNARPLTYTSSDPADFRPLTPNDFLNKPPTADPPVGYFDDALPQEHYRYVQRALNTFWDLWKSVFLQSLAARKKWKTTQRNFAVGDVVMEIDSSLGRGQWSTGHVVRVFPGEDGLVRTVDVQLPSGIFRRGIQRLCLLEQISSGRPDPASGEDVPAISA